MGTYRDQVLELVNRNPGLTDREITNTLRAASEPQQYTNFLCRQLAREGLVGRHKRSDGLLGNFPTGDSTGVEPVSFETADKTSQDHLGEDELKRILDRWLQSEGWQTQIAWGRTRGIDIEAIRENERWIIEVKGCGSRSAMRVNYFLGVLGETLQRMNDPNARYSIALPDMQQFRGLWDRLPHLAKSRTEISVIFVSKNKKIEILE